MEEPSQWFYQRLLVPCDFKGLGCILQAKDASDPPWVCVSEGYTLDQVDTKRAYYTTLTCPLLIIGRFHSVHTAEWSYDNLQWSLFVQRTGALPTDE